jgi:DNA-binding NarL/FixJ family response regulator
MSTESIKVLIVEDHLLTRLGLTMVLNAWPTITVVGEADNGITALDLINEIKPDVAVVDIGLPQMDGIECTTIVKSSKSNSRILLRSSHQEDDAILAVIGSGADGYCLKDSSDAVLISAIETVASGYAWLDSRAARQILSMLSTAKENRQGETSKVNRHQNLAHAVNLNQDEQLILETICRQEFKASKPDQLRQLLNKIASALSSINGERN